MLNVFRSGFPREEDTRRQGLIRAATTLQEGGFLVVGRTGRSVMTQMKRPGALAVYQRREEKLILVRDMPLPGQFILDRVNVLGSEIAL